MKKEIKERKDVELLVNSFYQKVNLDLEIGLFFNEISGLDWNTHLPKMYDFWSTILLDEISYSGNPMTKHIALDKKATLKPQHFNKWLSLWIENIQENFTGEKAENAIKRAKSIAQLMQYKVEKERDHDSSNY